MEIAVRSLNEHLEVGQSLQAVGDRRLAGSKLAAVGDDREIAGQLLLVLGQVGFEADAAHLLFAFNEQLDIDR